MDIQISENEIRDRAAAIAYVQAKQELMAEKQAALEAERLERQQAGAHFNDLVRQARDGITRAQAGYAQRAQLALEVGVKLAELITLDNGVTAALDASVVPAFEFGRAALNLDQAEITKAVGGSTPAELHARIGIHPTDDTQAWAALILTALVNGNLLIGTHIEGGRAGSIQVGERSTTFKFN